MILGHQARYDIKLVLMVCFSKSIKDTVDDKFSPGTWRY